MDLLLDISFLQSLLHLSVPVRLIEWPTSCDISDNNNRTSIVTPSALALSPTVERKTASVFYWLKTPPASSVPSMPVTRYLVWTVAVAVVDSFPGIGPLVPCTAPWSACGTQRFVDTNCLSPNSPSYIISLTYIEIGVKKSVKTW